jgi:ATP-dependent RNA helicase DeaD
MTHSSSGFSELNLAAPLVKAVTELGYETVLPIQAACIPPLLAGRDVLGLAQTGTGKTGAFALPLLSRIDLSVKAPQVLVLTPTRELAIQVAEAFQAYARHMKEFHVLPIYGGQSYAFQFNQLRRGPHVVVGTPGRVQDHLDRGTLDLGGIISVVLDEADEMLRMGFVEAVESILGNTPDKRQMALFSATMPAQIKRISKRHLKDPVEIRIETKTMTAENIEQVYLVVPQPGKFEALVRVLETESYDGVIIFARTRLATTDLAEKLSARGYDVAALSGEVTQIGRERIVKRLKSGKLDMIVATDVAARGLDVERISLVINYDIPGDSEAYIHRIGRTGRVGRYGKAILFANPRERRLLDSIERLTRQPLKRMEVPSHDAVTRKRVLKFREELTELMATQPMSFFEELGLELMESMKIDVMQLAAGALCYAQKDQPLQAKDSGAIAEGRWDEPRRGPRDRDAGPRDRGPGPGPAPGRHGRNMILYRIDAGSSDGVEVRNIVGAVTNESGLRNRFIGQIRIHPDHSTIELPDDLPPAMIEHLRKVYVGGKAMMMTAASEDHHGRPAPVPAPAPDQAETDTPKPRKSRPDQPKPDRRNPEKRTTGKPKPGKLKVKAKSKASKDKGKPKRD